MIIEDKAGCGFIFTLRHVYDGCTIFMELGVSNELIDFQDSIEWSISKEQAGMIARHAKSPTCNEYLLEIGCTNEFGFWHIGKWYTGCELTYDFLAYDEIVFTVTVPLEDAEFCNILTALGIKEWDRDDGGMAAAGADHQARAGRMGRHQTRPGVLVRSRSRQGPETLPQRKTTFHQVIKMMIAKCKGCGMHYPVRENEKGKKCPQCKEAGVLMDYQVYKKGLRKRVIVIAAVTGVLTTAMGFYAGGFYLHWALMIYAAVGTVGGVFFALNREKASLAEIAAAVREER